MSATLLNEVGRQGQGTTSAIDTTGATLIVVALATYGGFGWSSGTFSDNQGNTYIFGSSYGSTALAQFAYCSNPITSTGHTFTTGNAIYYPSSVVGVFGGTPTSTVADINEGAGAAQPGSATPAYNNELVLAMYTLGATGTASVNEGFTVVLQENYASGVNMGSVLAYLNQGTVAALNPTGSGGSPGASAMISFQTVSGLAPGSYTFWVMEPMVPTFPSVPVGV